MLSNFTFTDPQGVNQTDAFVKAHERHHRQETTDVERVNPNDYDTVTTEESGRDVISFRVWYWPTQTAYENRNAETNRSRPYDLISPETGSSVFNFTPDASYDQYTTLEAKIDAYLQNVLLPSFSAP